VRHEHTRRQTIKAIGILAVGTSLAGCTSSGGSGNGGDGTSGDGTSGDSNGGGVDEVIEMTDALEFEPADLNVEAGETVAWENVGSVIHTVTAFGEEIPADAAYFASGGADSERAARDGYPPTGGIDGGESYENTFETTGTYEYFCIPHEGNGMTGTIDVFEPAGGDAGCPDYQCEMRSSSERSSPSSASTTGT